MSRRAAAQSDRERPEERRRCPECRANTFEDNGVNPFVDPYDDNLSTFALDVDTASYVVTRNHLEGGQLPPIGAVRVEEFVNNGSRVQRTQLCPTTCHQRSPRQKQSFWSSCVGESVRC